MRRQAAVVMLVIVSVSAACGSDDTGAPGTTSTPPPPGTGPSMVVTTAPGAAPVTVDPSAMAGFVGQAEAICKERNDEQDRLYRAYPSGMLTDEQTIEGLNAYAQLNETTAQRLRALPQPPGKEAVFESIYGQMDELGALIRTMAAAFPRKNQNEMMNIGVEYQGESKSLAKAFRDQGFVECGKELAPPS